MDIQRIITLVKETKAIITNREMAAHVKEKELPITLRKLTWQYRTF